MMAPVRNDASLMKVIRLDWKGLIIPIQPDTTDTIKNAAPINSPIANDPDPLFIALKI